MLILLLLLVAAFVFGVLFSWFLIRKLFRDSRRKNLKRLAPFFAGIGSALLAAFLIYSLGTEAVSVPTGAMADTVLGIHKVITCPKCRFEFPVNSYAEVEPNPVLMRTTPLYGYCCPNCRNLGHVEELQPQPQNMGGDRVLVQKSLFHHDFDRGEVVVFRSPEQPSGKYLKRLVGFGGETIAIYRGDLYVNKSLRYPEGDPMFARPNDPGNLWEPRYMYSTCEDSSPQAAESNPRGMKLFIESRDKGFPTGSSGFGTEGFEIIRKSEQQLLANRRIVWDNDKQPSELAGKVPSRWFIPPESQEAWSCPDRSQPIAFTHTGNDLNSIRYRHLSMPWKTTAPNKNDPTDPTDFDELAKQQPVPIDNFLGYNAGRELDPVTGFITERSNKEYDTRWVGDLILECEVELEGNAEVVLELSKGVSRFQATFGNGKVSLSQTGRGEERFKKSSRSCKVSAGKYKVRFANVDCKLWAWVNGKSIDFGEDSNYQHIEPLPGDDADAEGWVKKNDVDAPASVGAKGKVVVSHITLHRDIYYTRGGSKVHPADLYYVQPGHFFCLGDNSAQSADSRKSGTVPERLLQGTAMYTFFPLQRHGAIK